MVVVRDVLCRVKSAVRVREEKKLQSFHGIDQHAGAGKPDRELLRRGAFWPKIADSLLSVRNFRQQGSTLRNSR